MAVTWRCVVSVEISRANLKLGPLLHLSAAAGGCGTILIGKLQGTCAIILYAVTVLLITRVKRGMRFFAVTQGRSHVHAWHTLVCPHCGVPEENPNNTVTSFVTACHYACQ